MRKYKTSFIPTDSHVGMWDFGMWEFGNCAWKFRWECNVGIFHVEKNFPRYLGITFNITPTREFHLSTQNQKLSKMINFDDSTFLHSNFLVSICIEANLFGKLLVVTLQNGIKNSMIVFKCSTKIVPLKG
jgi:hypothetical protein